MGGGFLTTVPPGKPSWGSSEFLNIKYDVSCWVFFVDIPYQVEEVPLCFWFTEVFVMNACWRADSTFFVLFCFLGFFLFDFLG